VRRQRATRRLADDIAPCLDALARSTAGGRSLGQALAEVAIRSGPFAQRLCIVSNQHALGVPLPDALARLRHAEAGPEERLAWDTLDVLARFGGAVPATLDRAAIAVRERRALAAERRAGAAQARLSAAVLSLLPLVVSVWTIATDRRIAHFVLHQPAGWICTSAAALLNGIGWLVMSRMIRGTT